MRGRFKNQSLRRYLKLSGLMMGLLLLSHLSFSAEFTSSVAGGDWDDTNSWNEAGFPGAADNVTIDNSIINVNVASACSNLTISTGGTLNRGSNNTLSVSGDLTLNGTASITGNGAGRITNVTGNFIVSSGATATIAGSTITVTGTSTMDGDLTLSNNTGIKTFQGLVTINAAGSWTSTAITTAGRLIFQNGIASNGTSFSGGDVTFDTNAQSIAGTTSVSFANDVNVTGITLTNNLSSPGEFTVTIDLQGTGGFTQGTNATLNIGDDALITTFTASASPNTVSYNSAVSGDMACGTHHHITIDKTGTAYARFTCNTTVNGDITVNSGQLRSDDGSAYTINITGTTTLESGTPSSELEIQTNTSIFNFQGLIMNGSSSIDGGSTTGAVNVATTLTINNSSNAIDDCILNVTGATTVNGDITFSNNNGVKTFESLVTLNAGATWTSTAVTTNNRMVFENGITNNGTSFSGGDATFNTNTQSLSGSESVSFSRDVTVTGITLTNDLVSPDAFTVTMDLQGTGGFTQGTDALLNIGDDTFITTLTANANPNTVVYNTALGSVMVCPTANTFHHLTIDKTAAGVQIDLPCNLTINGDFTINGGTVRSDINTGAFTHTISGSTSILSGSSTGTYLIRTNASTLNMQDLTMNGGIITAGDATSNVNIATTFNTTGSSSTINGLNLTITGASTIDGPIVLGNNTGVKTFQSLVTINVGGSWNSDAITTAGRLIFQNGISNDGLSFSAEDATFSTNAQTLSGGTTLTFNSDVLTTGIEVVNNATVEMTNTGTGTLSGTGTWTQGTGTLDYAGQTITVGTFNASGVGNTVNYNRGGVQDIYTPSDGSYYDITFSTSGTKTALATLDIDRNLLISGATLDVSVNTADLTVEGNWTNDGTFTQGNQTVTFDGSAASQTIGGSTSTSFNILVLNNASGFTLGTAIAALTELTMTDGNVDLGSSTLTLGTSAGVPGTLTYTAGDFYNGTFIRYYDTPTQTLGATTGLFPMADTDGNTRPFYINPSTVLSSGGTLAVSITTSDQASTITAVDDNGDDIVRRHNSSWDVTTGGGISGGEYGIRAEGTGFGDIDDVADLRLMTGGGVTGNHGGSGGSTSSPIIDRTAVPSGSIANSFHIGSIDATNSPLPIELLSFDAEYNEFDIVELTWATLTELNNDYFTIERSADGIKFSEIAQVNGTGTSSERIEYSYQDHQPLSGNFYYRLTQTDFDGEFEIFQPIRVEALFDNQVSLYPNPTPNNSFNIRLKSASESRIHIIINDSAGKQIQFQSIHIGEEIEVLPYSQLQSGIYFVSIQIGSDMIQQKLLVK